jgi:hypothetical protein
VGLLNGVYLQLDADRLDRLGRGIEWLARGRRGAIAPEDRAVLVEVDQAIRLARDGGTPHATAAPRWVRYAEAARIERLKVSTVRKQVSRGTRRCRRVGRTVYVELRA